MRNHHDFNVILYINFNYSGRLFIVITRLTSVFIEFWIAIIDETVHKILCTTNTDTDYLQKGLNKRCVVPNMVSTLLARQVDAN